MADFFDNLYSPQNAGLLGLAQGLLAGGGPSRVPVGFGQALGQGLMGGLASQQQAQAMQEKQQMLRAQQQHMAFQNALLQEQAKKQQRLDALMPQVLAGINGSPQPSAGGASGGGASGGGVPPVLSLLASEDPAKAKALLEIWQANNPNLAFHNGLGLNPRTGQPMQGAPVIPQTNQQGFSTQTVPDPTQPGGFRVAVTPGAAEAFGTQQNIAERARAGLDLVTVPPTSPNAPPTYSSRLDLLGGGAPMPAGRQMAGDEASALEAVRAATRAGIPMSATWPQGEARAAGMSPNQEMANAGRKAFEVSTAENNAKIYNNLQNASMANPEKIAKMQQIGALLGDFEGGKFSKTGLELASAANSAGFKVDKLLGNKQAAEALANEVALELRSTGAGNGMPGSMSDADREFLKSMAPGLSQSADGRQKIIAARVAVMERENKVADMARQYKDKYGQLDSGFFTQLQAWSNRNPIFGKR